MNSINVCYIKKITREDSTSYVSVEKYEDISEWKLEVVNSHRNSIELIIIIGKIQENFNTEKPALKIFSPKLMYQLPVSRDKDEWPIIYTEEREYLPLYLLKQLLDQPSIYELIEMGAKLSKHSTKLLTFQSLENSLNKVFNTHLTIGNWALLSKKLLEYLHQLIKCYPFLGYLPIRERLIHRVNYVSDLSFSWELYLQYFYDKWIVGEEAIIPDLNKSFEMGGWSGNFFDRSNPFWEKALGTGLRFKLNNQQKEFVYKHWINWLDEPK